MEILAKDNKGEISEWEIVPDKDLWQDGEITSVLDLMHEIEQKVLVTGKWKLIREVEK